MLRIASETPLARFAHSRCHDRRTIRTTTIASSAAPRRAPFDFHAWLERVAARVLSSFASTRPSRIDFVSPSVRTILGYEPEEMLGRDYREFFDLDHPLCAQLRDLSIRMLAHDSPDSSGGASPSGATGSLRSSCCASARCSTPAGAYVGRR